MEDAIVCICTVPIHLVRHYAHHLQYKSRKSVQFSNKFSKLFTNFLPKTTFIHKYTHLYAFIRNIPYLYVVIHESTWEIQRKYTDTQMFMIIRAFSNLGQLELSANARESTRITELSLNGCWSTRMNAKSSQLFAIVLDFLYFHTSLAAFIHESYSNTLYTFPWLILYVDTNTMINNWCVFPLPMGSGNASVAMTLLCFSVISGSSNFVAKHGLAKKSTYFVNGQRCFHSKLFILLKARWI